MTVDDVRNTLPLVDDNVYMDQFDCYISPEDFVTRFEGAELTCASLSEYQNATPGWIQQFEKWRDDGVMPA